MNEPLDIKGMIKDIDDAISRAYAQLNPGKPFPTQTGECPTCGGSGVGLRKTIFNWWDKVRKVKRICGTCHGRGVL